MPGKEGEKLIYRGIGIDGCPGGWAVVWIEGIEGKWLGGGTRADGEWAEATQTDRARSGNQEEDGPHAALAFRSAVYPDLRAMWAALRPDPARDRILLDMPIGLAEGADGSLNRVEDRRCDRDCRKLLPKRRKSSVFPVPARQALHAADPSAANEAATGRRLSRQSLNLLPKIREVDDLVAGLLARGLPVSGLLDESHPELAFLRLNGGEAPAHGKKEAAGRQERLEILAAAGLPEAELERLLQTFVRKQAAPDDLLDAAALALCAWRIVSGHSPARGVTEGDRRQHDYDGRVEMNIVYI